MEGSHKLFLLIAFLIYGNEQVCERYFLPATSNWILSAVCFQVSKRYFLPHTLLGRMKTGMEEMQDPSAGSDSAPISISISLMQPFQAPIEAGSVFQENLNGGQAPPTFQAPFYSTLSRRITHILLGIF